MLSSPQLPFSLSPRAHVATTLATARTRPSAVHDPSHATNRTAHETRTKAPWQVRGSKGGPVRLVCECLSCCALSSLLSLPPRKLILSSTRVCRGAAGVAANANEVSARDIVRDGSTSTRSTVVLKRDMIDEPVAEGDDEKAGAVAALLTPER